MKPFLWMMLIGTLCGIFLFYVWGKVDGVRAGYELDVLLQKKAALEQEHERLRIRFSQLTSPERIASEAKRKLKLRAPSTGQVYLVNGNAENAEPGPPAFGEMGSGEDPPLRLAQRK